MRGLSLRTNKCTRIFFRRLPGRAHHYSDTHTRMWFYVSVQKRSRKCVSHFKINKHYLDYYLLKHWQSHSFRAINRELIIINSWGLSGPYADICLFRQTTHIENNLTWLITYSSPLTAFDHSFCWVPHILISLVWWIKSGRESLISYVNALQPGDFNIIKLDGFGSGTRTNKSTT